MNSDFIVFTCRNEHTLAASDSRTLTGMSLEDEPELSSLIPAMNTSVSASTVAETF